MNAPLPPLPASLSRAERDDDIDARILQAEQRLIAREENLRRGFAAFGQQAREAARPGRLLKPALLAAAVAVAVWCWPRRRHAEPRPHGEPRRRPLVTAPERPVLFVLLAGIPWTRLLSHVWPMLPQRWQERLNPATAASMLTLGLPVLEGLFGRRHRDEPVRSD